MILPDELNIPTVVIGVALGLVICILADRFNTRRCTDLLESLREMEKGSKLATPEFNAMCEEAYELLFSYAERNHRVLWRFDKVVRRVRRTIKEIERISESYNFYDLSSNSSYGQQKTMMLAAAEGQLSGLKRYLQDALALLDGMAGIGAA